MHRLQTTQLEHGTDVAEEPVSELHYRLEPFMLSRLREACCDAWPAFQPGLRKRVCHVLEEAMDVAVSHGTSPEATVSGAPRGEREEE